MKSLRMREIKCLLCLLLLNVQVFYLVLHKIDVGHGAKELKLHKLWSRRIIEEFFL